MNKKKKLLEQCKSLSGILPKILSWNAALTNQHTGIVQFNRKCNEPWETNKHCA